MSATTERILPADVYDTLDFSALVYGGIGANKWTDGDGTPCCIHGHAAEADGEWMLRAGGTNLRSVLWYNCLISGPDNDEAVFAINMRRGQPLNTRVPFVEWCAELGVVRGAS